MESSRGCVDREAGELLAAYELGLLDREETRAFEDHLRSCTECLEELYRHAPHAAALRERPHLVRALAAPLPSAAPAELMRRLARLLRRPLDLLRASTSHPVAWPAAVPVAVAAAALVVAGLFLLEEGRGTRYAELAQVDALPYVPLATRNGAHERPLVQGLARYSEGRYAQAAELLEQALAEAQDLKPHEMDQLRLYLAIAHLLSRRPEPAIPQLEIVARSPLRVLADRAHWYLAQASLLAGDPAGARRHLEELAGDSPGYRDAAREQLREIERVQ